MDYDACLYSKRLDTHVLSSTAHGLASWLWPGLIAALWRLTSWLAFLGPKRRKAKQEDSIDPEIGNGEGQGRSPHKPPPEWLRNLFGASPASGAVRGGHDSR